MTRILCKQPTELLILLKVCNRTGIIMETRQSSKTRARRLSWLDWFVSLAKLDWLVELSKQIPLSNLWSLYSPFHAKLSGFHLRHFMCFTITILQLLAYFWSKLILSLLNCWRCFSIPRCSIIGPGALPRFGEFSFLSTEFRTVFTEWKIHN